MIAEDRQLLSRLQTASRRLVDITLSILGVDAAEGRPSAERLRALAEELDSVAADLRARADQVTNTVDAVEQVEVERD